jgi:hypothetical protein
MKPRRAQRLDGITAGSRLRKHDMIFINGNKPVDQADEFRKKQVERRDEQRFLGEFRMHFHENHFRDQGCDAQKVADPDARKWR